MPNQYQLFAGLALLSGPMAWFAERRYQALPALSPTPYQGLLPFLSVIIPARNESDNLKCLLPTLHCQQYNGRYEVIVVDDQSLDDTSAVAHQFNAIVIKGKPLPDGWLGKPYACHQGALAAQGEWLLFTDADTLHHPTGLARAVGHALENNLDGLSLFLEQETHGPADTLALMVAFTGMIASLPQENTFLNGQHILLRRQVYFESGGFSAVAGEPLEDLALGHHLHAHNYRVPVMQGSNYASVRMYKDWRGLWQGLVRIGGGSLRWMGLRSLISVAFITVAVMPVFLLGMVIAGLLRVRWFFVGWLSAVLGFLSWGKRFGSYSWAFLAPLGALIVQVAATWGLVSRLIGRGFRWKGRIV